MSTRTYLRIHNHSWIEEVVFLLESTMPKSQFGLGD
jgi:hypothetical protein